MFKERADLFTETAAATFKNLKPEYQKYILQQIDQLLEIQKKEQETGS